MNDISRRVVVTTVGGGILCAAGVVLTRQQPASGPPRGVGRPTSFGTVALLGSSRLSLTPTASSGSPSAHPADHDAGGSTQRHRHEASVVPVPSAVHGAWTDAVVVDLVVHNTSSTPVELSPGQFRVHVGGDGPTVSLYSADREAGHVEPGSTTSLRIRYLVPTPDHSLSLEFQDPGAPRILSLGALGPEPAAGPRR